MASDQGPVSRKNKSPRKRENNDGVLTSPAKKRNKSPRVRVVGGRIYDSINGKTCHQCRQKTMDFVAACKSQRNNKPCRVMYCHKCLLNRYKEKAEEVDAIEGWSCPRCRDKCNCSVCMKRKGHKPTGRLDKRKRKQDQLEDVLHEENISRGCKKNSKKSTERLNELSNAQDGDETLIRLKKLKTSPSKLKVSDNAHKQDLDVDTQESENNIITVTAADSAVPFDDGGEQDLVQRIDDVNDLKHKEADDEIPLPMGTELKSVAGIDMHVEDAGNALQFLEFCSVFEKVLELKDGLSKHVLQDIFHGRSGRRAKFSLTVQFHIDLLSVLHDERGEECSTLNHNAWFDALKALGLDSLQNEADYATIEASQKLRLLNLLCDEVLGKEKVRKWINEQRSKHLEKIKEAKQEVQAAKKKEKSLKQKMKDDLTKAIIKKQGSPLSVSEHEALMKSIKSEVEEAHAKVLESKGVLSKNNKTSDAFRIDPIFTGRGGNAYWNFNSYSGNSDQILRQNVGQGDDLTLSETWFAIDEDDKQAIEKLVLRANKRPR